MRVLVNGLAMWGARTGVGHYTAELLRCLDAQTGPADSIDRFPGPTVGRALAAWGRVRPWLRGLRSPACAPKAGEPRPPAPRQRPDAITWLRVFGRGILDRHFRSRLSKIPCDLYHEPNFIPVPSDVPTVATLHDLSAVLHPEWHPADRVAHFQAEFRRGLTQCVHFISISEFARQEIVRHLNVSPDRVTRTYMGVRPGLGPMAEEEYRPLLDRLGFPPRYLLFLGTLEPRKNLLTLLKAYCGLPDPVRSRYPLVLAGGWGWNTGELRSYLDAEARARGVLHVGYLKDEHLPAVYNGARALAFPSFYEGFGLPPVEMLACGGAVLGSTAGAIAETVGGQAHLIDPLDQDGWRDALSRVATDDDWWHSLRRGARERVRSYTWDACAGDTWKAYQAALPGVLPARRRAG